jgi:prephenate dehydrogenase
MTLPFRRVAVLGSGLVGGSFALALRRAFPAIHILGWDRAEVLARARERGAIDEGTDNLASACGGADLVYIALPIEEAIRLLPEIAAVVSPEALVTDASSTKAAICAEAGVAFSPPRLFLGGHPIAGRERGGIECADPELFRGAPYVLAKAASAKNAADAGESRRDARVEKFLEVIEAIGARPVWLDASEHDRLFAYLSHLPQLAAVALAETVLEGAGEAASQLAGPGLADALRLAGSPFSVWAGICRTNPELRGALDELIAALERIRERLRDAELRDDFQRANRLYKILRRIE